MRLHYYTTAVTNSYCVGVHNGHGFGSLFAKLFSKVAAKTAAKAAQVAAKTAAKTALKVAKTAGRKALKVVTTKGVKLVKDVTKEGLKGVVGAAGDLAVAKINSLAESSRVLPEEFAHKLAGVTTEGVRAAQSAITKAATNKAESFIDKGVAKVEQAAGVKRKQRRAPTTKKKVKKKRTAAGRRLLTNLLDEDE